MAADPALIHVPDAEPLDLVSWIRRRREANYNVPVINSTASLEERLRARCLSDAKQAVDGHLWAISTQLGSIAHNAVAKCSDELVEQIFFRRYDQAVRSLVAAAVGDVQAERAP